MCAFNGPSLLRSVASGVERQCAGSRKPTLSCSTRTRLSSCHTEPKVSWCATHTRCAARIVCIEYVTAELREIDGIEIVAEPDLTVVAFRHVTLDNRELLNRINAKKRVMLTPTVLGEIFVLRICIVSFRTHRDRIDMCLEDIRDAVNA